MNLRKNKKGQVIKSVFLWIGSVFIYFLFGYTLVKEIVTAVFLSQNPTGLMLFFGTVIPYIPIIGLMYWGYTILNESTGQGEVIGV